MFVVPMLLVLSAPAQVPVVSTPDRITAAVDDTLKQMPSTGAAVGVVRNGKLIYVRAFGTRNRAENAPVDENTRFEIGSVTKQFTAAAILQLKEAGRINVDDPLSKYLPSVPHASDVTVRHLLNQVSGYPDYLEFTNAIGTSKDDGSLEKIAHAIDRPLHFKPGERWEYSNTNYYLLGAVIAKVSGQPFEAYVRQHLFAPAGMTHSAFVADEAALGDMAMGYWQGEDMKGVLEPAPAIQESWAGGAGAIVSTIADLANWDNALASGKIVTPDDFALMSSAYTLSDGSKDEYGMGLGINERDNHLRVWHNGGSNGSLTMNATYPNDRIDIIVFENDRRADPNAIEAAVFGALFPDVVAAARRPATGEDPAVRMRAMKAIDETIHGTMTASEVSPEFAKLATPTMKKQISGQLMRLGKPTAIIYQGKGDRPDATRYTYRVEFGSRAMKFVMLIDKKTSLIDGIGIGPGD